MCVTHIEAFVHRWFAEFDQLPSDHQWFLQFLGDEVQWLMPEGDFHGHQGFGQWYQQVRAKFKPGCVHQLQQIEVTPEADDLFQLSFQVRLIANSYVDSPLQGQPVDMMVNEHWQLRLVNGNPVIERYRVIPIQPGL